MQETYFDRLWRTRAKDDQGAQGEAQVPVVQVSTEAQQQNGHNGPMPSNHPAAPQPQAHSHREPIASEAFARDQSPQPPTEVPNNTLTQGKNGEAPNPNANWMCELLCSPSSTVANPRSELVEPRPRTVPTDRRGTHINLPIRPSIHLKPVLAAASSQAGRRTAPRTTRPTVLSRASLCRTSPTDLPSKPRCPRSRLPPSSCRSTVTMRSASPESRTSIRELAAAATTTPMGPAQLSPSSIPAPYHPHGVGHSRCRSKHLATRPAALAAALIQFPLRSDGSCSPKSQRHGTETSHSGPIGSPRHVLVLYNAARLAAYGIIPTSSVATRRPTIRLATRLSSSIRVISDPCPDPPIMRLGRLDRTPRHAAQQYPPTPSGRPCVLETPWAVPPSDGHGFGYAPERGHERRRLHWGGAEPAWISQWEW